MFDLEPVVVSNVDKRKEFWTELCGIIGFELQHDFTNYLTFGKWAHSPSFAIAQASEQNFPRRVYLLSLAGTEEVKAFYRKAITIGAKEVEVPDAVGHVFMAKFLDLDGNTMQLYCKMNEVDKAHDIFEELE